MSANPQLLRIPMRLALLSLAALWACYFVVATLRGAFMGFDFVWPIISRRLAICVISALVMAAVLPLLGKLEKKTPIMRLVIVLVGALPLSLLLSVINDIVFADLNTMPAEKSENSKVSVKSSGVSITTDENGTIVIKHPDGRSITRDANGKVRVSRPDKGDILADVPIYEGFGGRLVIMADDSEETPSDTPSAGAHSEATDPDEGEDVTTVHTTQSSRKVADGKEFKAPDGASGSEWRWANIIDTAFGRYFLILSWAALYFALLKTEEARAAERREGEYRRAAEAAELRALRYQVNPHFLFNTLNSLSALVMVGREEQAEEMIQNLSTFYRRTLSGDTSHDIPLHDEVELQRLYFAIEAVRFPDRLKTHFDIADAVKQAKVPGMILQPLVENSVKYAVAVTQEPVTIAIKAYAEGSSLVISVADDGPGTAVGFGTDGKVDGCGIGLANVRDRLRARYGPSATITFGKRPDRGFETILRVPLEVSHG